MHEWSVRLVAAQLGSTHKVDEDLLEGLTQAFGTAFSGPGEFGATEHVAAATAGEAVAQAEDLFNTYRSATNLPDWPVVAAEVTRHDRATAEGEQLMARLDAWASRR